MTECSSVRRQVRTRLGHNLGKGGSRNRLGRVRFEAEHFWCDSVRGNAAVTFSNHETGQWSASVSRSARDNQADWKGLWSRLVRAVTASQWSVVGGSLHSTDHQDGQARTNPARSAKQGPSSRSIHHICMPDRSGVWTATPDKGTHKAVFSACPSGPWGGSGGHLRMGSPTWKSCDGCMQARGR